MKVENQESLFPEGSDALQGSSVVVVVVVVHLHLKLWTLADQDHPEFPCFVSG